MKFFILFIISFGSVLAQVPQFSDQQKVYLQNKKEIKMCVDPDWEPFEKINVQNEHDGIAADLIKIVSQRIGVKIVLIPTKTWEESIEFSKNHICDVMSFLNETPKRKEWLTFTDVLFSDPNVLVGRAERKYIEDISQAKLTIALPKGTAMAERFTTDFPNLTIIPTITEDEAFKLVEDRKADIALRSMIVTAYTIKKQGLFNLKIIGEPKGYENYLRMGVRKDEPILRDVLNLGIKTLTKEDVDSVVNKHIAIKIEKITTFAIASWIFAGLIIILLAVLLWNYTLKRRVQMEVGKNKAKERIIMEQKRRSEIGELIGSISHQWKTGLTQISSLNLENLLEYEMHGKSKDDPIYERIKDIEKTIKFMSTTMNTFLSYYKENDMMTSFSIKESINHATMLTSMNIKQTSTKIEIVEKSDLQIYANLNEWIHVWLNLISNSLTAAHSNDQKKPLIKIILEPNQIIYQDNCGGLKSEMIDVISHKKHSGLGLRMIEKIISKNQYNLTMANYKDGLEIILKKTKI